MRLKTEIIDDVLIVRILESAVDAGNAMDLKAGLIPLMESNQKVVLDMSRIKFMDSSGVGAMLSCLRTLHKHNGDLKLFAVKPQIRQLFKLVRLDTLIEIQDTQKNAVQAFNRPTNAAT